MPKKDWWDKHRYELLRLGRVVFAEKYHLSFLTVKNRWSQLGLPPICHHRPEWWETHRAEVETTSFSAFLEKYKTSGRVTQSDLVYWRRYWGVVDKDMSKRFSTAHQYGRAWWETHSKELAEMPTAMFVREYDTSPTSVSNWRRKLGIQPPPRKNARAKK